MKRLSLSPLVAGVRRWVSADDRETRTLASLTATSAAELKRVRESEARLRQITDIAPVLLWVTDPDGLLTYVNKHWLDFTGQRVETELGDGWKDGIHPDDRHPYATASNDAFARRQPFRTELRLRRFDGKFRWLLDVASPMHDATGAFAGYVGSCLDITDRKAADQALTTVSGRLLEAQEQERSRLASELHDDINQRLALLAIELEQLRLDPPSARKELVGRIDDLQQTTLGISRDVQALSHELHSSKLDFLGLVPALSSFFREFSQRTHVEVRFEHSGIPLLYPAIFPSASFVFSRRRLITSSSTVEFNGSTSSCAEVPIVPA